MGSAADPFLLRGRRILVVEDEMLVAMELEGLLRALGCSVLGPVPDVGRALTLLERERPDAALLDLNLNGQSVVPVAAALSAKGVPFMLVTGYSRRRAEEPVLQNAMRLSKPINEQELARALTALVPSA